MSNVCSIRVDTVSCATEDVSSSSIPRIRGSCGPVDLEGHEVKSRSRFSFLFRSALAEKRLLWAETQKKNNNRETSSAFTWQEFRSLVQGLCQRVTFIQFARKASYPLHLLSLPCTAGETPRHQDAIDRKHSTKQIDFDVGRSARSTPECCSSANDCT